ncbi:hypothetical protein HELRODRAFT_88976, partial [Helobdella robusta]|uniref:Non-canonical purine NTP phosphatase/PRRC1 domain-containing protein n=1 Tax=Helobdella robusta TaxID=6412 RepID=T1G778_HELRO
SVETMITTLDPGMKAVIYSGGDVDVIITTTNDEVVSGVRQAFQEVFGKATVNGVESRSDIAVQPVGFMSGLNGAGNKIMNLRNSGSVHERQTLVSYEGFIHEIFTDQWFFIGCLTLKDPLRNIDVSTFTQAIPLNPAFVQLAQEFTPTDYDLRWSGLAVSVGETINRSLPHVHPTFWHKDIAGVTLRTMVYQAAIALATLYKNNSNFHHFHHHH